VLSANATIEADAEPNALPVTKRDWSWWLGAAISVGILVAAFYQLRLVDISSVAAMVPSSPLFWLAFAGAYFIGPAGDWLIFRRLWSIPASGFVALTRKMIGNELLLGYIGEVYFYTWARRRTQMTSAPFGAIKDVAILSALAGNAVTLAMLALAFPLIGSHTHGIGRRGHSHVERAALLRQAHLQPAAPRALDRQWHSSCPHPQLCWLQRAGMASRAA
jgi:hypothetical protein